MNFEYPPGYNELPDELKENIRKEMLQQKIIAMHLGEKYLDYLNITIMIVKKFCQETSFKENLKIKELNEEIDKIVEAVKNEIEKFSFNESKDNEDQLNQ